MNILRLFPILAGLLFFGLTACNEDIDFAGDQRETAVVYALLDQADSLHYVKITRAFGGTNNALETALIADSSYFTAVDAVIEEYSVSGGSQTLTRSWPLEDTILTNKQPGVFYSPEQKVYYFKTDAGAPLIASPTVLYKLKINVNNGEFQVNAETQLVQSISMTSPSALSAFTFASSNIATNGYKTTTLSLATGTAKIIDTRLQIYFNEYFNGVPVEKSFIWKLGESNGTSLQTKYFAEGKTFYELVKANCTNDPSIDKREFTRLKVIVTGGADELNKYLLVNKPSSSLAQSKPVYTNLTTSDGRRAIGLFSARMTYTQTKLKWLNANPYPRAIDNNSIKELCTGAITGSLLFCSDHPADLSFSYACQ